MSGGHNISATTKAIHPDLVLCTIDVGRRYLVVGRKFVMPLVEFRFQLTLHLLWQA